MTKSAQKLTQPVVINVRGTICILSGCRNDARAVVQQSLTAVRRAFESRNGSIHCAATPESFWELNQVGDLFFHIGFLDLVQRVLKASGVCPRTHFPAERPELQVSEFRDASMPREQGDVATILDEHHRGQFVVRSFSEVVSVMEKIVFLLRNARVAIICRSNEQAKDIVKRLRVRVSDVCRKASELESAPRVAVSTPSWYRPDQTDVVLIADASIAAWQREVPRGQLLQAFRRVIRHRQDGSVGCDAIPQRVYGFRGVNDNFGSRMELRVEEICGPVLQSKPEVIGTPNTVEIVCCRVDGGDRGLPTALHRVAKLVQAIDATDLCELRGLGAPESVEFISNRDGVAVGVVVDDYTDGCSIRSMLSDSDFIHRHVGKRARSTPDKSRSPLTLNLHQAIITTEALKNQTASVKVDVIVWLGRRPCPQWIIERANRRSSVHVVDVMAIAKHENIESAISRRSHEYRRGGVAVCRS